MNVCSRKRCRLVQSYLAGNNKDGVSLFFAGGFGLFTTKALAQGVSRYLFLSST